MRSRISLAPASAHVPFTHVAFHKQQVGGVVGVRESRRAFNHPLPKLRLPRIAEAATVIAEHMSHTIRHQPTKVLAANVRLLVNFVQLREDLRGHGRDSAVLRLVVMMNNVVLDLCRQASHTGELRMHTTALAPRHPIAKRRGAGP